MKTWNLGNTTVRNPERIKDALRVLKEQFEGRQFDKQAQAEYFTALIVAEVIQGDPSQDGSRDWSGRKWAGSFNKLGLATGTNTRSQIKITDVGNALLSDASIDSDIFLRQMLKIQLPSPTESKLENAAIHPFYLVLSVALALKDKGLSALSKEELALFIQSTTRDDQVDETVEAIQKYRTERSKFVGRVEKRRFYVERRAQKALETDQKPGTLQDYADTTVRYSSITGIFTVGRQSLEIKEDQINLARAIVEAGAPPILEEEAFIETFHNPLLPALPTDDTDFLEHDISALAERLSNLSAETGSALESRTDVAGADILHLKRRRQELEDELIKLKELQFYRAQGRTDQVVDILNLFESIKRRDIIGGSDYLPAWAEWGVWRVFLSINTIANPISETRGFKINTELYPVHHAKGGAADLRFEYEDNTLIPAEITLNTGERQYAAEREPVRNHVLKLVEKNPNNKVIGLFVAPNIQPRTAHDFYTAYTSGDYSQQLEKAVPLDILPLTIEQFCQFLPGQSKGCDNYIELRAKIDDLLALRTSSSDGSQWLSGINQYFTEGAVAIAA